VIFTEIGIIKLAKKQANMGVIHIKLTAKFLYLPEFARV